MASKEKSVSKEGSYSLNGSYSEESILSMAESIITERFYHQNTITSLDDTKRFLTLHFRDFKREVFTIIFLDTKHHVLVCEDVFTGTIDTASVYPREVLRKVIEHNAAAVIFAHNHPSGDPEASTSDRRLTTRLVDVLTLINVRVLDHIIVGGSDTTSFAENGWL